MSPDDSSPSLVPLFDRLREGDPAAENDILTHCQERLKELTRRMLRRFPGVRRQEETSDVFAAASIRFLKALRELSFAKPADFLCLAACQIRWTLLDLARTGPQQEAARGGGSEGGPEPAADSTNDPVKLAMWSEFHDAVAALPEDERRLFDLLFYQGLTLPDASHLLGVPLATLKYKWQGARTRMMARFRNDPPV